VSTALAVRNTTNLSIEAISKYCEVFKASGMFPDIKSTAQAVVKIQAGAELGLQPFQAMKSVHIIQGNCTLAGHTIAAMVKSHPRYDYVLEESTDKVCRGYFVDKQAGTKHPHSYNWEDAERAGDTKKDNYRKHPAAMLFNRFVSSGQKKYAPDATNGVLVYTADELGGQIDHEGQYVETTAEEITQCEHTNKYTKLMDRAMQRGVTRGDFKMKWDEFSNNRFGAAITADKMDADGFNDVYQNAVAWCKQAIEDIEALAAADAAQAVEEAAEADLLEATI
jgi:hypothetical protein